jgi:hypothetical protein
MNTNFKKTNFNIADIVFQKPKKDKHGNRTIDIFNKLTNDKLQISSPLMRTWGFDKNKNNDRYTVPLMFPTEEYSSTESKDFLFTVQDIQDKVLDYVINNSEFIFGEKLNPDVIKTMFKPILIIDKRGIYPPTIRPQIDCIVQGKGLKKILEWKNFEIYDEKKTLLFPGNATPIQLVPKNCEVATLLRISHIWIGQNQQWKIVVKVLQRIVKTPTPKDLPKVTKCQISLTDEDWKIINSP